MDRISFKTGLTIVVVILALLAAFLTVYTVGPGQRGVLMTFGKIDMTPVEPGIHLKIPFVQTVHMMRVRIIKYQAPESTGTKDLQQVTTTIALNFSLNPKKVTSIYQQIGNQNLLEDNILAPAIAGAVKTVTPEFTAEQMVTERAKVKALVAKQILDRLNQYDLVVHSINIVNFSFSGAYSRAIERKQIAQQNAQKAVYNLQQAKTNAQQQVAKASAAAQATLIKAKAQAQATLIQAKADAKAMKLKNKFITRNILALQTINRWKGNVPQTWASSGKGDSNPLMMLLQQK